MHMDTSCVLAVTDTVPMDTSHVMTVTDTVPMDTYHGFAIGEVLVNSTSLYETN